jgi:cytochrome oxidase assembly protein ShyY1
VRFPLLRPRWLGIHLLAVLAAVTCFGLGYWQYLRAQEPERDAITSPVEDLGAAVPLDSVLEPGAYMAEAEANTAVTATGTYADAPLLAPALSPEGDEGYHVVVPLVTGDGTALAVSRGWVPAEEADAVDDLAPLPEGEVEATGWLMSPQKEEDGYVAVDVPDGQIERIAPSLLVNAWPYRLYEGYLILGEQTPADGIEGPAAPRLVPPPEPPQGIQWNWRSLSYAVQWVVFGGAVLVFWGSLIRRESAAATGGGEGPEGPASGGADGGLEAVRGGGSA